MNSTVCRDDGCKWLNNLVRIYVYVLVPILHTQDKNITSPTFFSKFDYRIYNMGPCHMNARRHEIWFSHCFRKSWSRSIESAPPQAKTIQCYIHVTGLWCNLLCHSRIIWQTTLCLTDIFNEASAQIKCKTCSHKHISCDWIVLCVLTPQWRISMAN